MSENISFRVIDLESYDNYILVNYYGGDSGKHFLTVVDLASGSIAHEFVFDTNIWTAFILENEIYLTTNFYEFQVYGLSDFEFKRDFVLPAQARLGFGLVHPKIYQNQLVVELPRIQPSSSESTPGIININDGNLSFEPNDEDLVLLNNEVQRWIVDNLDFDFIRSFDDFMIDMKSETFVFKYLVSDTSGLIVFADYSGTILSYVPVPVNPQIMILH
ncbi:hypothetical protein [Allomuricauda sp. SCSIO 65647]|uniref:hypothetical protein n=1 Tax=Allomuricauda sp. SCSIO 65647 TaxID=2908843 RepID=UPI001F39269B|nr:hypothetical protein [Muricauda sp. SCSIO 65647]UJH66492.1 hypothetical protein L0P89_11010 [Muricauda sp. SCSIO 65647]